MHARKIRGVVRLGGAWRANCSRPGKTSLTRPEDSSRIHVRPGSLSKQKGMKLVRVAVIPQL